jgi:hypothetical protein
MPPLVPRADVAPLDMPAEPPPPVLPLPALPPTLPPLLPPCVAIIVSLIVHRGRRTGHPFDSDPTKRRAFARRRLGKLETPGNDRRARSEPASTAAGTPAAVGAR